MKVSIRLFSRKYASMPKCNFKPSKYEGRSYDEIRKIRQNTLAPSVFHYYKEPLLIHQGHMQWLYDHNNRRYLDFIGGIVTVGIGHSHPVANEAVMKQTQKLWHTTNIYMHPEMHEYAEELVAKFPDPLKVVYLVNSGSEANDFAFLLAKIHTGHHEIITIRNSYHGMSSFAMGATNLGGWRFNAQTHQGFVPTMNADPYRGPWGGSNCRDSPIQTNRKCSCQPGKCEAGDKYVNQLKDVLKFSTPKSGIAGMIAESIQGIGGTVQFPKNFLKPAFELIRQHGGLCISDEVQTGFGRLGSHFWGFQTHNVLPDIVTMAKSIGNGMPLGAVVTTKEIASSLSKAGMTFNTYGGNPLAVTAGKSVLQVIKDEGLQENCATVGTYLLEELGRLQRKYPGLVGDVRGKGLMIGMEMIEDESSQDPMNMTKMNKIWEEIKDEGVLIGKGGVHGNVFRIKPPMCITKEDVQFSIYIFDKVLQQNS